MDDDFSNFMNDLMNNKVIINENNNKKISFTKKEEYSKFHEMKNKMSLEKLKITDYNKIKSYLKHNEENNLTNADYREIEKSINEDKKICENCKANIYENNFHKGWKNEAGEFILLCATCSKKYFNGALEVKFDNLNRKEEMMPINKIPYTQSLTQFRTSTDSLTNPNSIKINFQVINSTRPVEDGNLLSHKRPGEKDNLEPICANRKCNKTGKKSDFLNCSKCDRNYHQYCLDTSIQLKHVSRFKWLCPQCKKCQGDCLYRNQITQDGNNKLMRCNTCDRTFHKNCYSTIVLPVNNKTYCSDCINCKNCNTILPVLSTNSQYESLMVKGYRVCDICWKYYKTKLYCPKCLKIYKQQSDSARIYCNKCLNSYHAECEGLTANEVNERSKLKNSYTCIMCKSS